jgi:hypothetical protein
MSIPPGGAQSSPSSAGESGVHYGYQCLPLQVVG